MKTEESQGKINVHKLMEVLSDILSDQYAAKITITVRPKEVV